jgi:hypothetical protein
MIEWTITSAIVDITGSSASYSSASASGEYSTSTNYRTYKDTPGTPGQWDEGQETFSETYASGSSSSGSTSYSENSSGTTQWYYDDIGAHTQDMDGGPYYPDPPEIDPTISSATTYSGSTVSTASTAIQTSTTTTQESVFFTSATFTVEATSVLLTHTKTNANGEVVTSPDTTDPVGTMLKSFVHTETSNNSTYATTVTVEATTENGTQPFYGNYNVATVVQASPSEILLTYALAAEPQQQAVWTYATATRVTLTPTYATYQKGSTQTDQSASTTTNSGTAYTVTLKRTTHTTSTYTTAVLGILPASTYTQDAFTIRTTNDETVEFTQMGQYSGEVTYYSKSNRKVWDFSYYPLSRQNHTHLFDEMGQSYVSTNVDYALQVVQTNSSGVTSATDFFSTSTSDIEVGFNPGVSPPVGLVTRTVSNFSSTTYEALSSSSSRTEGNAMHPASVLFDATAGYGFLTGQTRWNTRGVAIGTSTGAYFTADVDTTVYISTARDGRSRGYECATVMPFSNDSVTVFSNSLTYMTSASDASGTTSKTSSALIGVAGTPIIVAEPALLITTAGFSGMPAPFQTRNFGGGKFVSNCTVVEAAAQHVYYNLHSQDSTTYFAGEATVLNNNVSTRNVNWRIATAMSQAVQQRATNSYSVVPRNILTWVDV